MRSAVLGVWGGLLLSAGVASAAELEAHGPPECPKAVELAFRVERNVGMPLGQTPPVRFVVEIEREAAAYVAHLSAAATGNETKERVLRSADCSQLADAIVVAITLALGVSKPTPAELPRTEPAGSEPRTDAPEAFVDTDTDGAASPLGIEASAAPRPALSFSLVADAGSLPAPGLGVALGAELDWERLELHALGTLLFEQHTSLQRTSASTAGADLQLFAGGLLACTTVFGERRSEFAVPACLGLELGRLAGVGTGVTDPKSGSALWSAPRLDIGARWNPPHSALSVGLALMGATPLERSRFALSGSGTIYRPSSVVGRLSLSVGLGFE